MKKFIALIFLLLSGCATTPAPGAKYINEQSQPIIEREKLMQSKFESRRAEIEKAHSDKTITEAEYLTLKNNLDAEINVYFASEKQNMNNVFQQADEIQEQHDLSKARLRAALKGY